MNKCPIIKDTCWKEECTFWRDEDCVVVTFFQQVVLSPFQSSDDLDEYGSGSTTVISELPESITSVPDDVHLSRLEELFKKEFDRYLRQPKREFPPSVHYALDPWLKEHGVDGNEDEHVLEFAGEAKAILDRIKLRLSRWISKYEADRQKHDEERIPELTQNIVNWASEHNIRHLSLSDLAAFIYERELVLCKGIDRKIWSLANVALKSKNKPS